MCTNCDFMHLIIHLEAPPWQQYCLTVKHWQCCVLHHQGHRCRQHRQLFCPHLSQQNSGSWQKVQFPDGCSSALSAPCRTDHSSNSGRLPVSERCAAHAASDCENAGCVDPDRLFGRCRTDTTSECRLLLMHVQQHASGNTERQHTSFHRLSRHVACYQYASAHAPYKLTAFVLVKSSKHIIIIISIFVKRHRQSYRGAVNISVSCTSGRQLTNL